MTARLLTRVGALAALVLGLAGPANADTRIANLPSCWDKGTIKAYSDTKVDGRPMLGIVYSDAAGKRDASEYVLGDADHPLSIDVTSLVPPDLATQAACSLWSANEWAGIEIGGAKCSHAVRTVVDNGFDASLKRVAWYGNNITIVIEAFYNNFFNGPEHKVTDLTGAIYYWKVDQASSSFIVLHGEGPQLVQFGVVNLLPGHHEVSFGTLDYHGQEDSPLGNVCL